MKPREAELVHHARRRDVSVNQLKVPIVPFEICAAFGKRESANSLITEFIGVVTDVEVQRVVHRQERLAGKRSGSVRRWTENALIHGPIRSDGKD